MPTTHEVIAHAIRDTFGTSPWSPGDALKKAKTKNAFAHALSTPPTRIKTTDLKNLVNQMWEDGVLEIIPPKDRERSFKFRLKETAVGKEKSVDVSLLDTYKKLKIESQFRHVYISDIQEKSGVPIEAIHAWASGKARKCEFELGQADWSLATKRQRDASIRINGTNYLTVGLLT